jgi:hypothetical protein
VKLTPKTLVEKHATKGQEKQINKMEGYFINRNGAASACQALSFCAETSGRTKKPS